MQYISLGIIGIVIALVGVIRSIYGVAAIGIALILAAFLWFFRSDRARPEAVTTDEGGRGS